MAANYSSVIKIYLIYISIFTAVCNSDLLFVSLNFHCNKVEPHGDLLIKYANVMLYKREIRAVINNFHVKGMNIKDKTKKMCGEVSNLFSTFKKLVDDF